MREAKSAKPATAPWRYPVALERIPETGQHFDLVADAATRAAVGAMAGLRDLPHLAASFEVSRHGIGGLHVVGHVSATVGQICVVTLETLTNTVEEDIDLVFAPPPAALAVEAAEQDDGESDTARSDGSRGDRWAEPEPLIDGILDLGALASEFLVLGLDPYPRKPGAIFEPPPEMRAQDSPFAALAKLAKDRNER